MKKLTVIIALLFIQTQVWADNNAVNNTNVNKKPAQQVQVSQQIKQQNAQTKKQDEEYLLKYNIRDLEAAPWLHGGKRSYN